MTKRQKTENVLNCLIDTNIAIMELYKTISHDKKAKSVCDKSIRHSKKAKKIITSIKHDEILYSLYNSIIVGKETYFIQSASLPLKEEIKTWDKNEKGFQEFLKAEKEGKEEELAEIEKKKQEQLAIEKAREEGKKVEYSYDPNTKSVKPVIVENKVA